MSARPVPEMTELEQVAWDALQDGRLIFQSGEGGAWLPPREESPFTLSDDWQWSEASGHGTLISWVTYHVPYHDYFKDKLPYRVGVIELVEGPRLLAAVEFGDVAPVVDMPVELSVVRDEEDIAVPVFRPSESAPSPLALTNRGEHGG
ncbi:Zn-ribbon domain-containing OB-fold protein [Aeromicrobium sp. CTD01-1L150]|uniref:Zn-ribbon domain-containing OB-fold protein n=1 Tax=Aeromicrobium sp. CTD01-1L150 TaxID=3341830 RepID=UPI0035BF0BDB